MYLKRFFKYISIVLIITFSISIYNSTKVKANPAVGALILGGGISISAPVVLAVAAVIISTGVILTHPTQVKELVTGSYTACKDFISTGVTGAVDISKEGVNAIKDYIQGIRSKTANKDNSISTSYNDITEGVNIVAGGDYVQAYEFKMYDDMNFDLLFRLSGGYQFGDIYRYRIRVPRVDLEVTGSLPLNTKSEYIIFPKPFKRYRYSDTFISNEINDGTISSENSNKRKLIEAGDSVCVDIQAVKLAKERATQSVSLHPVKQFLLPLDTFNNVDTVVGWKNPAITGDKSISFIPKKDIALDNIDTVIGSIVGVDVGTLDRVGSIDRVGEIDVPGVIDPVIPGIDLPSKDKSLDFTPLKTIGIEDKFPFCIPFDLRNSFKNLSATPKAPKWDIEFDKKYFIGGGSFSIDFAKFEAWAEIIRWGVLVAFIISLILITRKII